MSHLHVQTALESLGFPSYCIPNEEATNLKDSDILLSDKLTIHTNPFTKNPITPIKQAHWMRRVLKEPELLLGADKPIVSVSGWPDDRIGLFFTALLAAIAFNKNIRIRCIDIANPEEHVYSQTHVVVLHNVITEATSERIQTTRDLVVKYRKLPRFLVLSGFAEPLQLFKERLRLRPDVSLLFDGWTHEVLDTYVGTTDSPKSKGKL